MEAISHPETTEQVRSTWDLPGPQADRFTTPGWILPSRGKGTPPGRPPTRRPVPGHRVRQRLTRHPRRASVFGDLPRALRGIVRVTRPGGRILVVASGAPENTECLRFLVAALQACVPTFNPLPMDPPSPPFQLASPCRFRQVLDGMFRERSGGEQQAVTHTETNIGTGTK